MKTIHTFKRLSSIALMLVLFYSCMDKSVQTPTAISIISSSGYIQEFSVIIDDKTYTGTIEKDSIIQLKVPYSDIRTIKPVIKLAQGASISPSPAQVVDLSKQIKYKAVDSKGISKTYVVNTTMESSPLSILSFMVQNQIGNATIDEKQHTVSIKVTKGTDISKLMILSITSSSKTSISSAIDQPINFSNPVSFFVKGLYNESQEWVVSVTKETSVNSENDIIELKLTDTSFSVEIDKTTHSIKIFYDNGAILENVQVENFIVSAGAKVINGIPTTINIYPSTSFSIEAENNATTTWSIVPINRGLTHTSIAKQLIRNITTNEQTGYDFVQHTILTNDISDSFHKDNNTIMRLDMEAQILTFRVDVGGGIDAVKNAYNFRSGYFDTNKKDKNRIINGTAYVKANGINFNSIDYESAKGIHDSGEKLSDLMDYTLKKGDIFIAKIREKDYYVIIQITDVEIADLDYIKYSFIYRY